MQTIGHLIINDEKILVLFRDSKYLRYLKKRNSGKDGVFLSSESYHLAQQESKENLSELKSGLTIGI